MQDFLDERFQNLLDFSNVDSLGYIRAVANEIPGTIRAISFISSGNPIKIFDNKEYLEFSIESEEYDDYWDVKLDRVIEQSERHLSGSFVLFNNFEDVWTALTLGGRDFHKNGLLRFLEVSSPEISIPYLSSEELRILFNSLDDDLNGRIIADKAIVYSHDRESSIHYEEREYYEVFNEAEEHNKYVDKLQFYLDSPRLSFRSYLTRKGESRFIGGSSEIYFNVFLDKLSKLISEKGELFEGKGREYGSKEAKPLEIKFDESVISDVNDNLELIKALDGVPKSNLTIYHKNPYLHASIMDYIDGSSADVFITSESKISIVPGFEASRDSLIRLCDNIVQGFREGEVRESVRKEKRFDDYFR